MPVFPFNRVVLSAFAGLLIAGLLPASPPPVRDQPTGPRVPSHVALPLVEQGRVLRTVKSGEYRVVVDETGAKLSLGMEKPESTRYAKIYLVGDTIKLKRASNLQAKDQAAIPVTKGEVLGVHSVNPKYGETQWVGVSILQHGKTHTGWIPVADVELHSVESPLTPRIGPLLQRDFAAASVLIQKAKLFDDGLMATAQLAAQQGAGKLVGKTQWLPALTKLALQQPTTAAEILLASSQLGQLIDAVPSGQKSAVEGLVARFLADELRSKPIGFYTWTPELTALFQQDRMLQTKMNPTDLAPLVAALNKDAKSRAAYEAYVTLIARLTNPPVGSDLRTLLAGEQPREQTIPLISTSQGPETNLIVQLFGNRPIPEGFDLSTELVERIRAGRLSLEPRGYSGWYDHQLWSLEPLVAPEKTPEAVKWTGNAEYRQHLEAVFKGAWALARETHIKDLELAAPASAAPFDEPEPKVKINVQPQLTTEPLATSYRRRANSYRFVRHVLDEAFGEQALGRLQRQTANGPIDRPLSEELTEMEQLFDGAAVMAERELGLVHGVPDEEANRSAQAQAFLDWVANMNRDPDIAADVRMMVPVFFDLQRKQTKVWIFLGWTSRRLEYSYDSSPGVTVFEANGKQVAASRLELSYYGNAAEVVTPVFREIYVTRLLNRDEFRRVCDTYVTPSAILEHLK